MAMASAREASSARDEATLGSPADSSTHVSATDVARSPDVHSSPSYRASIAASRPHPPSAIKQQQKQQEPLKEKETTPLKHSGGSPLRRENASPRFTQSGQPTRATSLPSFGAAALFSKILSPFNPSPSKSKLSLDPHSYQIHKLPSLRFLRSPTILLLFLTFLLLLVYTLFTQPASSFSSDTVDLSLGSSNGQVTGQLDDASLRIHASDSLLPGHHYNGAGPEPHADPDSDPESDPNHRGLDATVADEAAEGERGSVSSDGMWHGKLKWTPQPDRFLLAVCVRGQLNNRIGCFYRHLILAALLNRTLVVPPVLLSTSLSYCRHGVSGSPCPTYPLPLVWDLDHTRKCLGAATVVRTDEFAARFGRPLEVEHMRCWHAHGKICPMRNEGLLRNCLVDDGNKGAGSGRRRRRRLLGGAFVKSAAVAAAATAGSWFGRSEVKRVGGRRKLQEQQGQQMQQEEQAQQEQQQQPPSQPATNISLPLYTVQSFAASPIQQPATHLLLLPRQVSPEIHISPNATASALCFPRFVHVRDIIQGYAPLSSSVSVLAVGDLVFTAFLGLSEKYEPFKRAVFEHKRRLEKEQGGAGEDELNGMLPSSSSQLLVESDFIGPAGGRWFGSAGRGGLREWRSLFEYLPGCPVPVPIRPPQAVIEDGKRLAGVLFDDREGDNSGSSGTGGSSTDSNDSSSGTSSTAVAPAAPAPATPAPAAGSPGEYPPASGAASGAGSGAASGAASGGASEDKGGYVAVHWRRSDFKEYCVWSGPPGYCFYSAEQAGKCAADVAQRNGLRNIYVATDASTEQFEAFKTAAGSAFKVIRYPDNPSAFLPNLTSDSLLSTLPSSVDPHEASFLLHILLDKFICVHSTVFLTTASSTLSNDVARMREGFGVPAAIAAANGGAGKRSESGVKSDAVQGDVGAGLEFVVSSGLEAGRDGALCEGEKVWQPFEGLEGWMKDLKARRMAWGATGEWRR